MRLDTERRSVGAAPPEARTKPPPAITDARMFLTMEEFRVRHGTARSPKERVMHAARAAFTSSLLLAALWGLFSLLE
jgi:hypothetical protein